MMFGLSGRPKKLFVFVNPYGGKKSASKIFVRDVKPVLEDANVEYTVQGEYTLHSIKFCILHLLFLFYFANCSFLNGQRPNIVATLRKLLKHWTCPNMMGLFVLVGMEF